ncbi:unnamed protein product, partial [marine sediment metagenome]
DYNKAIEINPRYAQAYNNKAWILDSDGNRVGVWFAAQRQTAVRLRQNNRVVIIPPEPPRLRGIR